MALNKEEQAAAERLYLRHKSKVQVGKVVKGILRDLIKEELEKGGEYAKARRCVREMELFLRESAKRQAVKLSKEG